MNSHARNIPEKGASSTDEKKPAIPGSINMDGEICIDGISVFASIPKSWPRHPPTVSNGNTVPPGSCEPEESMENKYLLARSSVSV